jgi:hypothetical protein
MRERIERVLQEYQEVLKSPYYGDGYKAAICNVIEDLNYILSDMDPPRPTILIGRIR